MGTIGIMALLPGIGLANSYVAIFAIHILIQVSSNMAQSAYQGFIPDLVPLNKRGIASGVKVFLEQLGGIALLRLVASFMDRYFRSVGTIWLWLSLGALLIILLGTTLTTLLTVREVPGAGTPISLRATLKSSFSFRATFFCA